MCLVSTCGTSFGTRTWDWIYMCTCAYFFVNNVHMWTQLCMYMRDWWPHKSPSKYKTHKYMCRAWLSYASLKTNFEVPKAVTNPIISILFTYFDANFRVMGLIAPLVLALAMHVHSYLYARNLCVHVCICVYSMFIMLAYISLVHKAILSWYTTRVHLRYTRI